MPGITNDRSVPNPAYYWHNSNDRFSSVAAVSKTQDDYGFVPFAAS